MHKKRGRRRDPAPFNTFRIDMSKQLKLQDRQEIARLLQEGKDFREIAEVLKVDRTTILREINRNVGDDGIYDPELAESNRLRRKRLQRVQPGAVAQLPPNIREEVEKVLLYETPTVQRRQLIVDKYINEYGPVIKQKLVSSMAAMRALASEFYMSESAVYYLLKREGIYRDRQHPVCTCSPKV